MAGGRPPVLESVEQAEKLISDYFKSLQVTKPAEVPSITGLAFYLGFQSRQSLYDYEKDGEFSYTIKRARLKIEAFYEQCLTKQSPAGAIFALKNFGWSDKQEIEQKTTIEDERIDESKLTDEELRTLIEIQRKGSVSKA